MILLIKNIFLFIFLLNSIFSYTNDELNEMIEYVLDGNYIYKNKYVNNKNNESYYYKTINSIVSENDVKSKFLKGLIETDGEVSKTDFLEYYKKYPDNEYSDLSAVKIADYYYAKGIYLQASDWYKKVPLKYPDSKYVEKSISYYLNSLLVSGYKDTANYYISKFKEDFPSLKFSEEYNSNKTKSKKTIKNEKIISDKRYSVQIGSFKNYELAKNKKSILSKEGFLCRIDQLLINGENYYAVRTGTFKSKKLAKKEQMRLISRIGIYDSIITEIN